MPLLEQDLRQLFAELGPDVSLDLAPRVSRGVVVRRRRGRVSLAAAVLVATSGTVMIALSPGAEEGHAIDPAPMSSTSAAPTASTASTSQDGVTIVTSGPTYDAFLREPTPQLAALLSDGRVVLSPGVRILDHVDNPFAYFNSHDHSIGLELGVRGEVTWALLDYVQGSGRWSFSGDSSVAPGEAGYPSFRSWVRGQSQLECSCTSAVPGRPPPLVDLYADGSVVPIPGASIVRTVHDPVDLGETGRSAGVEVTYEGVRYWALVQIDLRDGRATGGSTFSATPVTMTSATSLEQWLSDGAPVPPQSSTP